MKLEDRIDALYAEPLDRFTEARNALAEELRSAGDRDGAKAVAALRKPSAPAWAINQAVRADRRAAHALAEAGDSLRQAQKRAVRGGDPAAMRDAAAHERELVQRLAQRAVEHIGSAVASSVADRIRDTLLAVSGDPELHEEFLAGRMTKEHERVGFGDFPDLKLVDLPKRAKTAKRSARDEAAEKRRREREERLGQLQRELAEAEDEARDLERRAHTARRKADAIREQVAATERSLG